MKITIKSIKYDPTTTITNINDGKNVLTITEKKEGLGITTTLQSNGDSIYPIMDLLKVLEGTH